MCSGLFNTFLHEWRELDCPDAPQTTIEFYLAPAPPPSPPKPQPDPPASGRKQKKRKPRTPVDVNRGEIAKMVVDFCEGQFMEQYLRKEDANGLFDNISFEESHGPGCPACTAKPGDTHSEPTLRLRGRKADGPEFNPPSPEEEEDGE